MPNPTLIGIKDFATVALMKAAAVKWVEDSKPYVIGMGFYDFYPNDTSAESLPYVVAVTGGRLKISLPILVGDVSGVANANTVDKIKNIAVVLANVQAGQCLYFDGTNLVNSSVGQATVSINPQVGTAYSTIAADSGQIVTLNNAALVTVTLANLIVGQTTRFTQLGALASGVLFAAGVGITIRSAANLLRIAGQNYSAFVTPITPTIYLLEGDLA